MNPQDPTLTILANTQERLDSIEVPEYVKSIHTQYPVVQELDKMKLNCILERAKNLEKPAICLLGPYSSGKTFILNYLIQDEMFVSKIEPTTAVITVIRHIDDKPATWPPACNVFTLKKNADLRSLDYKFVIGDYELDDLPQLTTYPEALKYDSVIVFLDKEILRDCIFYDCPGVGTMSEAIHNDGSKEEFKLTSGQEKTVREHEIQRRAIENADAFIILSAVIGGGGCFSDSNTGNILFNIANNMPRFPTTIPHGNLLFVGSQADPNRKDLRDEESILRVLQNAIQEQVELLPPVERQKFDVVELRKRIVLFYTLDQHEINNGIGRLVIQLKRHMQAASSLDIQREAEAQFAEERATMERTGAFRAALQTTNEQLLLGMQKFRAQITEEGLSDGIKYYSEKCSEYLTQSQAQKYYEELSRRYEKEYDAREKDWKNIISNFETSINEAKKLTFQEIEKILNHWTVKETVYNFIEDRFGENKEQARIHATEAIQGQINADFADAFGIKLAIPDQRLNKQLLTFDQKWLQRKANNDRGIANSAQPIDATSPHISNVEAISATQTFGAITAGLAGTTTLLAVGGSPLAAAAIGKVLAIGIAGFQTVGLGAAASGLLIGIPIYGWVAAGLLGVGYAVLTFFAWRNALATNIAKSLKKNKDTALQTARAKIDEVFETMRKIGQENLGKTKRVLDAHINEIHLIGKGSVSSKDLKYAAEFYSDHIKVLNQTLEKLKFEWETMAR